MDAVPALGQHTDAILGELGYSKERIAALRARRRSDRRASHASALRGGRAAR
jgi:hypothetical protein